MQNVCRLEELTEPGCRVVSDQAIIDSVTQDGTQACGHTIFVNRTMREKYLPTDAIRPQLNDEPSAWAVSRMAQDREFTAEETLIVNHFVGAVEKLPGVNA